MAGKVAGKRNPSSCWLQVTIPKKSEKKKGMNSEKKMYRKRRLHHPSSSLFSSAALQLSILRSKWRTIRILPETSSVRLFSPFLQRESVRNVWRKKGISRLLKTTSGERSVRRRGGLEEITFDYLILPFEMMCISLGPILSQVRQDSSSTPLSYFPTILLVLLWFPLTNPIFVSWTFQNRREQIEDSRKKWRKVKRRIWGAGRKGGLHSTCRFSRGSFWFPTSSQQFLSSLVCSICLLLIGNSVSSCCFPLYHRVSAGRISLLSSFLA